MVKVWNFKGETEGTIVTAQAFSTNYFKNKILKEQVDSIASYVNHMKKLLTT
jgi:hypothetical protein